MAKNANHMLSTERINNQVTHEEVSSLTHAILKRYGVDFTCYEPESLKRRVSRSIGVLGMQSIHDLWIRLLKDPAFIYKFMDEISVGLTTLFRDPVLWKTLKNKLKVEYGSRDAVQIWHAGCSTGEEVYSLGIVLEELGIRSRVKAIATDINTSALNQASSGSYHNLKLPEFSKNYREYNPFGDFKQYYAARENEFTLNPVLTSHVVFRHHNLITEKINGQFDFIFCRNVMIYFDQGAKLKLLKQFYQHLNPGGYLIIGFYDTLTSLIDKEQFEIVDLKSKIFRKKE